MTRCVTRICACSSLAGCLALATLSCSIPEREPVQAIPSWHAQPPARQRVAQFAFGPDATFRVCAESACPRATPKTLATAVPQPVPAPGPQPPSAVAPAVEASVLEVTVTFAFASATLTPAAKASLSAAIRHAGDSGSIAIAGRTDSIGEPKANDALARARALAVRDYLRGLAPDLTATISIDAKGLCCFVASNADEDGRAKNRRVDVVFNGLRGA